MDHDQRRGHRVSRVEERSPRLLAPKNPPPAPPETRPSEGASREHLQQALRQAQANLLRYRELFDYAPNGYLVTDLRGVIQEANHAAAAMFGASKQFLTDTPLLFLVAPSDRREYVAKLQQLTTQSGTSLQWELTLAPRSPAPLVYAIVTASAPTEEHPAGIRWTFRDITQRRQAEESLQAEKQFADGLFEMADAVFLVLDSDRRIVRTNHYSGALLGHSPVALTGRFFDDLLLADEQQTAREVLDRLSPEHPIAHGVHHLRTVSGSPRTMAWSARTLTAGIDGRAWILVVGNDITDLQDAQRRALQAERLAAVGEMIAGLAHESRNALQRSQSCLEILRLRLHDQPEALNLVDRVQKAQDDLHHLYEDVREYAAPIHLKLQECNVSRIWREAWDDLDAARASRPVELREERGTADLWCEVSPFHLKQVFRNLLDNALSVTTGSVRITVRCRAVELDGRPGLEIAVLDNGPGFDLEQRQRAFQPFFTTKPRGTGLGLAICKRLVEAQGGRIVVRQENGPGAALVITLPRRRA